MRYIEDVSIIVPVPPRDAPMTINGTATSVRFDTGAIAGNWMKPETAAVLGLEIFRT